MNFGYVRASFSLLHVCVVQGDDRLFRSIEFNPLHDLRELLPPYKVKWTYELRPRPHNCVLPPKIDKNFVTRYFYKLSMNTTPLDSLAYSLTKLI